MRLILTTLSLVLSLSSDYHKITSETTKERKIMDIKVEISPKVAWQLEPSEAFVYIQDASNGNFFELEDVGKDVWLAIVSNKSLCQIEQDIATLYNISVDEIDQDIKELILTMLSNDLIVIKSF